MALLVAQKLSLAFGLAPLLDGVSFSLAAGDKVALLGRNGCGKSTLLNLLRGAQSPDEGLLQWQEGTRVAWLPQDPPQGDAQTVRAVIASALAEVSAKVARYQALSTRFRPEDAAELATLEAEIQAADGWRLDARVQALLERFHLEGEAPMASLSGGWRRQVWLARALLTRPQVLLLDEPTNHLDLAATLALEELVQNFSGAVVFVTHDRAFLENVANRIWQLDRGQLLDVAGDYARFLRTREEMLHAEAEENARFDKKLAEEEIWIRQGIKARRTRNEGRVRALKAMRAERAARRALQGKVTLNLDAGERSGQQVVVAEDLGFAYPQKVLFRHFSDIVERGEKIGLIGANGAGKTTLLKILLGECAPSEGRVRQGTNLKVAYFDQLRAGLEENLPLRESLGQGKDYVEINGQKKHLAGYLQDFLFPPTRWNTPVSALSGGERARLLLAKLFAQSANVLVMDEPTNDLDIETLELLEEVLDRYTGTVLLVSHDRRFLDEVVTRSWVFNARRSCIEQVPGGFSDWLAQGGQLEDLTPAPAPIKAAPAPAPARPAPAPSKKKLSYKWQRELDALPAKIEALEAEIAQLGADINTEAFHRQAHARQQQSYAQLAAAEAQLEALTALWLALEEGNPPT